jgi:hypothetical protein
MRKANGQIQTTSTNCFATVYEFSRRSDKNIFAYSLVSGASFLEALAGNYSVVKKGILDSKRITANYGDIMVYLSPDGIDGHAAIYIDQGIWFEKISPSPYEPYRLTDSLGEGFGPSLTMTLIRIKDSSALVAPENAFGPQEYLPQHIEISSDGAARL